MLRQIAVGLVADFTFRLCGTGGFAAGVGDAVIQYGIVRGTGHRSDGRAPCAGIVVRVVRVFCGNRGRFWRGAVGDLFRGNEISVRTVEVDIIHPRRGTVGRRVGLFGVTYNGNGGIPAGERINVSIAGLRGGNRGGVRISAVFHVFKGFQESSLVVHKIDVAGILHQLQPFVAVAIIAAGSAEERDRLLDIDGAVLHRCGGVRAVGVGSVVRVRCHDLCDGRLGAAQGFLGVHPFVGLDLVVAGKRGGQRVVDRRIVESKEIRYGGHIAVFILTTG